MLKYDFSKGVNFIEADANTLILIPTFRATKKDLKAIDAWLKAAQVDEDFYKEKTQRFANKPLSIKDQRIIKKYSADIADWFEACTKIAPPCSIVTQPV